MQNLDLRAYADQFVYTVRKHREAPQFIRKHQLWKGFWEYNWMTKILIVAAILVGLRLFTVLISWFFKAEMSDSQGVLNSMSLFFSDFYSAGKNIFLNGSMKYVMLILLEVLVFHFCRRSLAILTGKDSATGFDEFLKAQIRMIKVSIRAWIMESLIIMIIGAAFSMAGYLSFLKPVLVFGVQCYYLGFIIVDNYNEQFELSIKESARYTRSYMGVALALGLVLNLLLRIPIAGALIGPLIAAVTVTLVMYQLSDLHLLERDLAVKLDEMEEN